MGGTGVSTCDDQTASYYNPAMLGFFALRDPDGARLTVDNNDLGRKQWGVGFDVTAGVTVLGNLSSILDQVSGADLKGLSQRGLSRPGDLKSLATVVRAIGELGQPGNAIMADANAGIGMRIGHWGLGARVIGQTTGFVTNTDLSSMVLGVSGPALANRIVASGAANDGQVTLLSAEQAQTLYERLGGATTLVGDPGSAATQAVQSIDYALRQSGVQGDAVARAYGAFSNAASGTGVTLSDNATYMSLMSFAVAEIPISYGFPINDHWAVGATLKGMVGRVYRNEVSVFSNTAQESLEQTMDGYTQSFNVGLDVSIAARTQYVQGGLIVRNLNRPSFTSPTVRDRTFDDVVLNPQATISEAVIPWPWLTLAVDADLNSVETITPGLRQQRVGTGIEVNPWRVVALRAGAYRNIADGDGGSVLTAGAGINMWAVRIDAAVAAAPQRIQVLDWELPKEFRASLGIMADF